jgi:uncharacterized protein (UPF0264 family)
MGCSDARPVAVVYADWQAAKAPEPEAVLAAADEFACPVLLVDTWNKSAGNLFAVWPIALVRDFAKSVHSRRMKVVLAGSLTGTSILAAAELLPDCVAVRAAACDGGRDGVVSQSRVRMIRDVIARAAQQVDATDLDSSATSGRSANGGLRAYGSPFVTP